jgi:3-hydroxymyristoyl/3-hydroxydecanoyl-(acyl carrier protein) dehydratase
MLPQDDYDSPEDLARQFELLRGPGATPGRFHGIVRPPLSMLEQVAGESRRARLDVPAAAPYFADHFPRRAVFPATLLLDSAIRVAHDLAHELPKGGSLRPSRVTHVKMRDFTLPGQSVEIAAEALTPNQTAARIGVAMKVGERTVATARVEFAPVQDASR